MKKVLYAMVAWFTVCSSFAAVQYSYDFGVITPSYNSIAKEGVVAYTNRWVQDKANLQNTLEIVQSSSVFVSFSGEAPAAFGAFAVDGTAKGKEYSFLDMGDGYYAIADAFNQPYVFEPGATVGFWVEGTDGQKIYNIPGMDDPYKQITLNGTAHADNNTTLINGFAETVADGIVHSLSGNTMSDNAFYFMNVNVGSATPIPSGQPLPGVMAALVLGGGALVARRKFKATK